MWLSGLHIPESYLTALVQATCRKNGWPLDHSTLYTEVTQYRSDEDVNVKPGQGENMHAHTHTLHYTRFELSSLVFSFLSGCFVSGLYLEGADWDIQKDCLVRSKPRVLVTQLPVLKIIPIEARRLKLQARHSFSF